MRNNKKNKNDTKYNADNEIIIGVTTKPKEKVRVEKKKTTRTESKSNQKKNSKAKYDICFVYKNSSINFSYSRYI